MMMMMMMMIVSGYHGGGSEEDKRETGAGTVATPPGLALDDAGVGGVPPKTFLLQH